MQEEILSSNQFFRCGARSSRDAPDKSTRYSGYPFYHVDLIPLLKICYPSQGYDETPQERIRNRFRQARVRQALDLIDQAYRGLCLEVWVDPSKGPLLTDQTTVNDDYDFVTWAKESEEGRKLLTPSLAEARSQFVKDLRRRVVADCGEVFKELMAVSKA